VVSYVKNQGNFKVGLQYTSIQYSDIKKANITLVRNDTTNLHTRQKL